MREAVKWIRQSGQPTRKYLIATDSRSLVDAIKANDWKDEDPVLNEIKEEIKQNEADITILWVPSHCGTAGNEKADKIADEARQLDQKTTEVSRKIVKAKIKGKKWEITHPRAKETYMERRAPRKNIEKAWPRKVRTMYARLQTDHEKNLKDWRHRMLGKEETGMCEKCELEPETTIHILAKCPATSKLRREMFGDKILKRNELV